MTDDLKIIKKYYGEKMSQLCRDLFPTLLETPGLLSEILLDNFAKSKSLYEKIISNNNELFFKNFIYNLTDKTDVKYLNEIETPEVLLKKAGYTLYECLTDDEIQSFKKYYQEDEAICTFNSRRLNTCYVYFAIKDNVDEIKRENFPKPKRQDEYGTSVISIQFYRDFSHTLSIKNRYNHRVKNPDATFSNNLDNIIPGLSDSFAFHKGMKQNYNFKGFALPGFVRANDGRYYQYNYQSGNLYFCPDNIVINDQKVKKYPKERYIVMDYFVFDMKEKKIFTLGDYEYDSFPYSIGKIKSVSVCEKKDNREITIVPILGENIKIIINKNNQMTSIYNPNVWHIAADFLSENKFLEKLNLPNVEVISEYFLMHNESLTSLNIPKTKRIEKLFLSSNEVIQNINLPHVKRIGDNFLCDNQSINKLDLPMVTNIGNMFMFNNGSLEEINLENVQKIGSQFLCYNELIQEINLPNVIEIEEDFLLADYTLEKLSLPNVESIGEGFLEYNSKFNNKKADDFINNFSGGKRK